MTMESLLLVIIIHIYVKYNIDYVFFSSGIVHKLILLYSYLLIIVRVFISTYVSIYNVYKGLFYY